MKEYKKTWTLKLFILVVILLELPAHAATSLTSGEGEPWCKQVAGGSAGRRDFAIDLSAAHAGIRFFGVAPRYALVDQALAQALDSEDPFSIKGLATYAAQLESVCLAAADPRELGPAQVRSVGTVAVVRPGTGSVTLPPNTKAVAIDLRGLPSAEGAHGLVLDMRGYPGGNHYEAAERIIPEPFLSPFFGVPLLSGPSVRSFSQSQFTLSPLQNPSYSGPAVLLVGPRTVSAAENFSIMLVGANRVTVVGRRSAGTNGNITGVQLPGAFGFTFTRMEILYPDHSRFHGIGIVPDIEVQPESADFRDDYDRDIEAAVAVLRRRMP